MNVIDYSPYNFDDSSIVSGSVAMSNALMFDTLNPDELEVEVVSNDTGKRKLLTVDREWYTTVDNRGYVLMTNDLRQFTYGDPVLYYYDGVLQGKYYIRSVDRLSVDHFKLSAFSAVGMWASIQHFGGIYDGDLAGSVIADLLTGFTYTIDPDVAAVPLYGYLPIASVRDNLQQVLFAIGASLMKNAQGNPHFKFLRNVPTINVSDERIFIGGKLNYKTPATSIRVTEHSYYISSYDVEVSLFDNTDGSGTADNKLVTFDEPCHNLVATGLTLGANGANYAYVTGTGTLTGKKYTHTQKIFSVPTGASGEPSEAKIEKATLVSPVNSANVAARVSDYKGTAEEVACGIVMDTDDIKPASLITFTDPYGDAAQGFVATMNITMSGKSKADCTIVKNYVPSHFGNNFSNVALITSSQTWAIPAGAGTVRIVLGQGGQAGQNGFNGTNSTTSSWSFDFSTQPGVGGAAGNGGNPGRVFVTDINTSGGSITFSIGAGGAPSATEGGLGNEGGHTTASYNGASYSSESGAIPNEGYRDVFSGQVYSQVGVDGVSGANGGSRNGTTALKGDSVSYNGITWSGGAIGIARIWGVDNWWAYGGSGGGAAYGANGGDGGNGGQTPLGYPDGGHGGNGANALQMAITPNYGDGGAGGSGGGGGGCPGQDRHDNSRSWGSNGIGGSYSQGVTGGAGYALVYY